jgi:sulfur carrier protein
MELRVNGVPYAAPLTPGAATVAALVRAWLAPPDPASNLPNEGAVEHDPSASLGVAVARNGEIVPRSRWSTEPVEPGDDVEIAAPFQGG